MEKKRIISLLRKYKSGKLSQTERAILESWYISHVSSNEFDLSEQDLHENIERIATSLPLKYQNPYRKIFPNYAAVASILLLLSLAGYYLSLKRQNIRTAAIPVKDIKPGGNKAILTLANGVQINLTDARNGLLTIQSNAIIKKTSGGKLVYQEHSSDKGGSPTIFNMISTPKGGQYSVTLSDGTNVMLDAESSIKYPVEFTGNERRVEIEGQVYFEVVHQRLKPFRVTVKGQTVEDVGTHFNVNAYNDETSTRTTLLEGSISILKGLHKVTLKPGQQAISEFKNDNIKVENADTEEVVAWKNGYFIFDNESIESVMRKISRWYDVDVIYDTSRIPSVSFGGSITMFSNVSKVLKMLETTSDVHFQLEGRKIFVTMKNI